MNTPEFWERLDELVRISTVVIDRPAGSRITRAIRSSSTRSTTATCAGHARPMAMASTSGSGSLTTEDDMRVTAIVVNVDLVKRDTELKLLLNCTPDEACRILATHNVGRQSAILIARPIERRPVEAPAPRSAVGSRARWALRWGCGSGPSRSACPTSNTRMNPSGSSRS